MSIDARIPQQYNQPKHNPLGKAILYIILFALALVFIGPLLFILNNSFRGRFFTFDAPFAPPLGEHWSGFDNYFSGPETTNFFVVTGWSFFITVGSATIIIFLCAMTVHYTTRVKTKRTNALYLLFVFSMVAPLQMVMSPTVKLISILSPDNPFGMILLYFGFDSGLSVFISSGFVKSIPVEIKEASVVDGCGLLQNYFRIVMPMLKPVTITVVTFNTMWMWSDYLLPCFVIGLSTPYRTILVVVQQLVGSHDSNDMGAFVVTSVLTIIPIAIFYLFGQKYIIKGVIADAVKG